MHLSLYIYREREICTSLYPRTVPYFVIVPHRVVGLSPFQTRISSLRAPSRKSALQA